MIKIASFALAATTALVLTACGGGGGNSDHTAAEKQLAAIQSAEAQGGAASADSTSTDAFSFDSSPSASPSISDADASNIDVCALLSPADASAVATADKLDGAQTASSVYKLTATKEDPGTENRSACRFDISDGGAEGTVLFEVGPGSGIDLYNDGTKADGLGDEAYTNSNGGTVVRVGGLLITEGDDSFGSQITLDLLRKMAPNLK